MKKNFYFAVIVLLMSGALFYVARQANISIYDANPHLTEIVLPSPKGAMAVRLNRNQTHLFMSWLEPLDGVEASLNGTASQLKWASWNGQTWSAPEVIAQSSHMFTNFADRPSVVISKSGRKYAHWLEKTSDKQYGYDAKFSYFSENENQWQQLGPIWTESMQVRKGYDGFVSMVPTKSGVQAFWIDGRLYNEKQGGPMRLLTAHITDRIHQEQVLDDDICSCCDTSAINTREGVIIFYRGRTQDNIRDMMSVRQTVTSWTKPVNVSNDQWHIEGCAVNGPKAAAHKDKAVLAWFTGAGGKPRVRVAFSIDAGKTFSDGIDIDTASNPGPMGKVDVVLLDDNEAIVSWVGRTKEHDVIFIRRIKSDGTLGPYLKIADIEKDRRVGFPEMERVGDSIYLAWGIPDKDKKQGDAHDKMRGLKMVKLDINDIPGRHFWDSLLKN